MSSALTILAIDKRLTKPKDTFNADLEDSDAGEGFRGTGSFLKRLDGERGDSVKLSVIISTWNCLSHIRDCLDSILSLDIRDIETIVVDSASVDGTKEYLDEMMVSEEGRRLGLKVIFSRKRVMWSDANQIGLDVASGEWLCFSNPDVTFNDTFLMMLAYCRERGPSVVAPQLINPDGSHQGPIKIVTPGLFLHYTYAGAFLYRHLTPGLAVRKPVSSVDDYAWKGEETVRKDHPVGSFFMVSRKVVLALRGRLWNPGYMNGVSDSDMFLNFKRRGIPVEIFPSCRMLHYQSFVTKRSPSWVEYDCSYGIVLYFRYWKMGAGAATLALAAEAFIGTIIDLLRIRGAHSYAIAKRRAWNAGQRWLGLLDGWRYRIRRPSPSGGRM